MATFKMLQKKLSSDFTRPQVVTFGYESGQGAWGAS